MKRAARLTAFWVTCYLLLAIGPLLALVIFSDLPPSRGFWIEFSAALGFMALAMFALQFVLTARFKKVAAPHGLDTIIQFHRQAGIVAVGFALLHPLIMIVQAPAYIEFLDPRVMFGRAVLLFAAISAMVLIIVLTFLRQSMGIPYEIWRLSHGLLAVFVVIVGLVHALEVEWYLSETWQRALWSVLTIGAVLLLVHVRIGKPLAMLRRPYRVAEVRTEGPRTWTISLEPVGHPGMKFRPGQFAWLTLGQTPFSLQQHPFSFSSSAAQADRIEFTIRDLGDFTSTIGSVKPDTKAFLEGPYGAFTPDLSDKAGLMLIAGGVGIAPMMSILRTLRDRHDLRPVRLIYSSGSLDEAIFRDELEMLRQELNLQIMFVLRQPATGFHSESGLLRPELLQKYLPTSESGPCEYFICGPVAMMNMAERCLLQIGVPSGSIHSERFDIA